MLTANHRRIALRLWTQPSIADTATYLMRVVSGEHDEARSRVCTPLVDGGKGGGHRRADSRRAKFNRSTHDWIRRILKHGSSLKKWYR